MKMTIRFIAVFLLAVSISVRAQVGINRLGANPDGSAMLDVSAANKGLLIPRIALTGTNDVTSIDSPATSLLVYNTATISDVTPGFYYYNGAAWKRLVSGIETDPVFTSAIDVSGSLAGDFLKYDGTKFVKFTPSLTESNYLYNTKYGVKLQARNDAQTDVDFVLSPKGNGGIAAQQPDGTATGGDNRGSYAVDLQMSRGLSSQVASGSYSVIAGGYWNEASKNHATIGGGSNNTAFGSYSCIPGGKNNTASEFASVAFGANNEANGMFSTATGYYNTTDGDNSFAAGSHNFANDYMETVFGQYATVVYGSTNNWVATDRLFRVGNGTGAAGNLRSNALTILKNANTTIGGSLTINGNGTGTSLTLPVTRGTSGNVLTTDGSGGTSWTAPAVGTVTGVTGTAPIISSGGATPVISITAATISVAGSMSAADKTKLDAITGTNTGNQTITLTGDVTGSGTGSFSATIAGSAVTNAKMANMATNTIKVNNTGSAAAPADLSLTANTFPSRKSTGNITAYPITDFAFDMLNDADAAAVRTTIGAGTGNGTVTGVTGTAPISVATGTTTPVVSIAAATTSAAGSMSAADKTKLDTLVDSQWTTIGSNIYYSTGNVGIGTTAPRAILDLGFSVSNRKIILHSTADNGHQFSGFGLNNDAVRFQLANTSGNFKFYGATSAITSTELFRIQGDGQIMIPALTTQGIVQNSATGVLSSSKGTANQVLKMNSDGTAAEWGNTTPILTQAQRDGLTPAEGLIIYNLTTHKPNYYNGTEWRNYDGTTAATLEIGYPYQGGIIAYVFQSGDPGYITGETHGLIAATIDQSAGIQWYNGSASVTGATASALGTGSANTSAIISIQGAGSYAAQICDDYTAGGYTDWFLPSKNELNKLYLNNAAIGGFDITAYYWSSTEYSGPVAWRQNFGSGNQYAATKSLSSSVRAVRFF